MGHDSMRLMSHDKSDNFMCALTFKRTVSLPSDLIDDGIQNLSPASCPIQQELVRLEIIPDVEVTDLTLGRRARVGEIEAAPVTEKRK